MSFSLTRHTLTLVTRACTKIMSLRPRGLPILQHLYVEHTADGCVRVTATNLTEYLTYTLADRQPGKPLALLLPFTEAQQLGQGDKEESVDFTSFGAEQLGITTVISGQRIGRTLPMPDANEFPVPATTIPVQPGDVAGLLQAYQRVRVGCSSDRTRLALGGVYLDTTEHVAVATDGRRLLMVPLAALPLPLPVLLPVTKVLCSDLLWTTEGQLGFVPGPENLGGWLRVVAGPWEYRLRTQEEVFPNYRQVIPRAGGESASVMLTPKDVEILEAALQQFPRGNGMLLYGDTTSVVVAYPTGLSPAAGPPSFSQVVLPLASAVLNGDQPVCVELDRRMLLDGLHRHCLTLRCRDSLRPVRAESADGALCVIMPMRLDRTVARALQAHLRGADHVTIPEQEPAQAPRFSEPPTRVPADPVTPEEATPMNTTSETATTAAPAAEITQPVAAVLPTAEASGAGTPHTDLPASSGLRVLPPSDPLSDWLLALDEVEEQAKALTTSVRELRRKAREVSRAQRGQEKEFKSAAAVIDRLKKVANY